MAVLGWLALGLVTALLASGFRRGEEGRGVLASRCASGMVGALLGGLVAVAAGVGPFADFFHTGIWLIALGGTVLALVIYELARTRSDRSDPGGGPGARSWAVRRAGGESERIDRNW
jgi:uncharacterized membrane protein YeaQ/YmgE (transglycosylase-associated protein family)